MNMYQIIKKNTKKAKVNAKHLEESIVKNKEELFESNPHTSIYKILDAIDEFNETIK